MTLSPFLRLARRPVAVALRLLLWPTMIMVLANLTAKAEDDALAAGLSAFAVIVAASSLLALADGLVLPTRSLVLVWSITTVVIAGLVTAQPLIDFLVHGPEGDTWAQMVQITLEDLPSSVAFFMFLVGVPVATGALIGAVVRRSARLRGEQAGRSVDLSSRLG